MRNYITDIEGIEVGHFQDETMGKGLTVILARDGASPGVDVRGSAPGTRETDLIQSEKLVDRIHAVVLSGGSAFGLDASSGVMAYLEEIGIGMQTPFAKVPIVSQAVIYDLNSGQSNLRPNKEMGYQAAKTAKVDEDRRGSVGAGLGATVSKAMGFDKAMKGGLGSATKSYKDIYVSALVVVNALGDVYDGEKQLTGPYDKKTKQMHRTVDFLLENKVGFSNTNTTIGVIATNAKLNKAQANKLASMGHDAFARAIYPVHTMSDGDTVFAMATNKVDVELFDALLVLAVDAMEEAIIDAIKSAESRQRYLSYSELNK